MDNKELRKIEMESAIIICSINNLSADDRKLVFVAQAVRDMAQASYSNFKVGAAVIDQFGGIHAGVNVERCTYSQTTHAEQNAIDTMVAESGPTAIQAIAMCACDESDDRAVEEFGYDDLIFPCGHCLQIIWENCQTPDIQVFSLLNSDIVALTSIGVLLPVRFGPKNFNVDVFNKKKK